ncbi:APC family permease [Streptomyces sp. BH097]|uniref:APC family permease n=1 Tax=unclassified Streptomyces TaxID=2593676 RepID=UPI003BB689A8
MTERPSTQSDAPHTSGPGDTQPQRIQGRLGVGSVVFAVLAWAAPLLVIVGVLPSMTGFAGVGVVPALLVTMMIVLVFSVGYNALTRYVDRPGAFYAYITAGMGRNLGLGGAFVALFTYSLLLLSTWAAFGFYARHFFVEDLGVPSLPWYLFALAGVALAGVSAYGNVEFSAKTLAVALSIEILLVLIVNLRIFFDGGPDGVSTELFTSDGVTTGGFGLAVLFAFLCFGGFESSAIYREEVKDPVNTITRATYVAVLVIGAFYILAAIAMVTGLGSRGIAEAQQGAEVSTMFSDLAKQYVGAVMPSLVDGLVIISTYATLLAQHNAVARYLYSFGRDGVFSTSLGTAHPKHHSPYRASFFVTGMEIIAVLVIAAVTAFEAVGSDAFTVYIRANGIGAVGIVVLLWLVSLAVIMYFRRHPADGPRGGAWRTRAAPILGLVGISAVFVLSVSNLDALIGAGPIVSAVLAVLVPLVFVVGWVCARTLRTRRPDVYARIGRQ